jgi:hypothetical protein
MTNLLQFIVSCSFDPALNSEVARFFNNTTEQQQIACCNQFCIANNESWIGDYDMDLSNCPDPFLRIDNRTFDLRPLVNDFMSKKQTVVFWKIVSEQGGRSIHLLETQRNQQLNDAVGMFSNILGSVGVNIQPEELKMFIKSNKSAIENRYMQCLEPKLSIQLDTKEDVDAFWNHMEIIYNIMHPYNKISRNVASE